MKSASVDGPKSLDDELDHSYGDHSTKDADVPLSKATVDQLETALAAAKKKQGSEGGDDETEDSDDQGGSDDWDSDQDM
jgi:hypothetical protein